MVPHHSQTASPGDSAVFIRALRDFRIAHGESQRSLAIKLGVSRTEYKQYESGESEIPDSFIAKALAHYGCADRAKFVAQAKLLPLPPYKMDYRSEDFVEAWIRHRHAQNLTAKKLSGIIMADPENFRLIERGGHPPCLSITARVVRAFGFDSPQALIAAARHMPAVNMEKDSIDRDQFSRALTRHIDASGKTRKDLYKEMRLAKNDLTDYENGVRYPTGMMLSRILTYCGASSVEEFIANAEHLKPVPVSWKDAVAALHQQNRQTVEAIRGLCQIKGIGGAEFACRMEIPGEQAQACLRGDRTLTIPQMKKLPQAMGYPSHDEMMADAERHPYVEHHKIIEAVRELCLNARMTTRQLAGKIGVDVGEFRKSPESAAHGLSAEKLALLPVEFGCASFAQMLERADQSRERHQRLLSRFVSASNQPVQIQVNLAEKRRERLLDGAVKPQLLKGAASGWQERLRRLTSDVPPIRRL